MEIPRSLENLKSQVLERADLVKDRTYYAQRIRDGHAFMEKSIGRVAANILHQASLEINTYETKLRGLDQRIFELDTVICSRLEAEFLDSVIRIRTQKRVNDAGDVIDASNFFFMPDDYKADDYTCIDENDIFFLKIIKAAFSVQNIDVIPKERRL